MIDQLPKNIMVVSDFEDNITFRCACDCGDSDHDIYIDVEYDKKLEMIFLNFYKDVYYFDSPRRDILWFDEFKKRLKTNVKSAIGYFLDSTIVHYYRVFKTRLKTSMRIMYTGYFRCNEDFIIRDVDHIDGFIRALEESKRLLLERQEKKKELSELIKDDIDKLSEIIRQCIENDPDNLKLQRKCLPLVRRIKRNLP
jgi:hypothetical protein